MIFCSTLRALFEIPHVQCFRGRDKPCELHAACVGRVLFRVRFRYFGSHLLAIGLQGILNGIMIAVAMSSFVYVPYLELRIVIVAPVSTKWRSRKVHRNNPTFDIQNIFRAPDMIGHMISVLER